MISISFCSEFLPHPKASHDTDTTQESVNVVPVPLSLKVHNIPWFTRNGLTQ